MILGDGLRCLCDFPITQATFGTLVLISHKGNSFLKFFAEVRRVALTNYMVVIRQSALIGTFEVVEVGCDPSPWRSNFCPLAKPPTQKATNAITTPAKSSAM